MKFYKLSWKIGFRGSDALQDYDIIECNDETNEHRYIYSNWTVVDLKDWRVHKDIFQEFSNGRLIEEITEEEVFLDVL